MLRRAREDQTVLAFEVTLTSHIQDEADDRRIPSDATVDEVKGESTGEQGRKTVDTDANPSAKFGQQCPITAKGHRAPVEIVVRPRRSHIAVDTVAGLALARVLRSA